MSASLWMVTGGGAAIVLGFFGSALALAYDWAVRASWALMIGGAFSLLIGFGMWIAVPHVWRF